jgi:hypothetical protein
MLCSSPRGPARRRVTVCGLGGGGVWVVCRAARELSCRTCRVGTAGRSAVELGISNTEDREGGPQMTRGRGRGASRKAEGGGGRGVSGRGGAGLWRSASAVSAAAGGSNAIRTCFISCYGRATARVGPSDGIEICGPFIHSTVYVLSSRCWPGSSSRIKLKSNLLRYRTGRTRDNETKVVAAQMALLRSTLGPAADGSARAVTRRHAAAAREWRVPLSRARTKSPVPCLWRRYL